MDILQGVVSPGTDEERSAPEAVTSPWIHIEAGLAISTGLPVLALAEQGITDGVFDPMTWGSQVVGSELSAVTTHLVLDDFILAVQVHERTRPHQEGFTRSPAATAVPVVARG